MLDKLENLLVKFENEKRELEISTSEFLIKYWRKRIRAVLNELGVLDQKRLQRLRIRVYETGIEKAYEIESVSEYEAEIKKENELKTKNEDDTISSDSNDHDSIYMNVESSAKVSVP